MHARVDAGTDMAMLGAWDASLQDTPADASSRTHKQLQAVAATGQIFLIYAGSDGGGPIDVYIDEPLPKDAPIMPHPGSDQAFLLRVPTGRLLVRGAENYRNKAPTIFSASDAVSISPGDYRVRCYPCRSLEDDESGGEATSIGNLATRVLSPEDLAIYRAHNRVAWIGCLGMLMLFLFPALYFPLGWKPALVVTAAIAAPILVLCWFLKRRITTPRWSEINRKISAAWLGAQPATFILQLTRIEPTEAKGLQGGMFKLR